MFEKLRRTFAVFLEKVSTEELTPEKVSSVIDELKTALIESDVAFDVAEKIGEELEKKISGIKVKRLEDKASVVREKLREILLEILSVEGEFNLFSLIEESRKGRKPFTILFLGINGTGKTTTIAKMAHLLAKKGFLSVLACSDTYRAGAIEQLEIHAKQLGVKMVKHKYGSDPASVAFDAIAFAKAKGINVVLIDTAGRMEVNKNLMEEMRKIVRVTRPDAIIFVGEALTGNDAVMQAQEFNAHVPITASILTKMDADAKGGAAISVSYTLGKPIIFIGTGQKYEDLEEFHPEKFVSFLLDRM